MSLRHPVLPEGSWYAPPAEVEADADTAHQVPFLTITRSSSLWYVVFDCVQYMMRKLVGVQTFLVLDKNHPSTTMLPDRWTFTEEVYNFRSEPVGVHLLLSVDKSSYTGSYTSPRHSSIPTKNNTFFSDNCVQKYIRGEPHPIGSVKSMRCEDGTLISRRSASMVSRAWCGGCGELFCRSKFLHQLGTFELYVARSDLSRTCNGCVDHSIRHI